MAARPFLPVPTSPRSRLRSWIGTVHAVSGSEPAGGERSKVIAGCRGLSG